VNFSAANSAAPAASSIHVPGSYLVRLDLGQLFPVRQPVQVELGSGDGGFLAQYAQRHPERNFIGVERLLGRLRKLDRKGQRAGLKNLRVIRLEAAYLVEYLLPANSIEALHIYFPDPWPKRKHRKNRLINEHFTEIARRALTPGGAVYLRTDDADYFSQMTTVFAAHRGYQLLETPGELLAVPTDFEREFQAQGIAAHHAAYQRRD
jgi:tRNA (guanine-N7-)-methyltransferase